MFLFFVLLFTVIPTLEIYLLFRIGGQIGAFNTVLIVLITGVLGASLARRQGVEILARLQNQMHQGQLPAKEIQQAFLVFAGGLLLLTPGFLTDILGLSFIFPVTRTFWRLLLGFLFQKAVGSGSLRVVNMSSVSTPPDRFQGVAEEFNQEADVIDVDFERR